MHEIARWLFDVAYSFHMPLFIMISGYLFYKTRIVKGWKYLDMVKEKWLRLGIPYIVFITFAIILKYIMPGSVDRAVDISSAGLAMNYLQPFDGALQEMWFVAVIFLYFLIYPVYQYLLRSKTTILLTLVIVVGMYFIPVSKITGFLAINRAVHFFVYFFIGMVISRGKLESTVSSWPSILISSILYMVSYKLGIGLTTAMSGSLAFWGLAIIIDKKLSSNIFHTFRNYTYQIFLIGIFAQIAVKVAYGRIHSEGMYMLFWIICILMGIYIPVLIAKLAQKTNNKFICRLLGL